MAAGVASTSRQIGSSLGVAVIGSASVSMLDGPFRQDFAAASRAGWWILTFCGALVFVLGLAVSSRWALGTAQRTAQLLGHAEEEPRVPITG